MMFHVKHSEIIFHLLLSVISVISTDPICARWYICIEMRCAPEWRNLSSTSDKGLKNHIVTTATITHFALHI